MNRRDFLKGTGVAAATAPPVAAQGRDVAIIADPGDAVASAGPPRWAAKELEQALSRHGVSVRAVQRLDLAGPQDLCIVPAGAASRQAQVILKDAGLPVPAAAESLAIAPGKAGGRRTLLACGADERGLVYALLELADRVLCGGDPLAALDVKTPLADRPLNTIRSVTRLFCSDVEDKPWFNDREMWPKYLTMLATQRFNRFNLSLGIGYDFLRNVTDGYFLFAYPFLLAVPGYQVRVPQLADAERDRNLEMLKFIGEETRARSLEFQLGIWMHGYEWINSPTPNYAIEGLNAETHGPYCRDAVRALLQAVPTITGVTFRIHGESGVEEGSYSFWRTVFEGVSTCGRKVEIDMHSKGMDPGMLDLGTATGLPLKVSPKYWAEHMGMPYHQADIRELERPRPGRQTSGLMKFSAGSRSFTRYGYADLLRQDRRWGIIHRIWPGTQRLLIWGDPLTAGAHSRAFRFCGSDGVEIMEPLSFKGRRGSGLKGDRAGYADPSLRPRWDWEKYLYSFRIWGRHLYKPDPDPDVWRRYLRKEFGPGAAAAEAALAACSRILPIVTTAHGASAGNNTYWPEVYLNQSMVDPARSGPYGDSPSPRVFGNVSPMDPQLFYRINDYADDLLAGKRGGKYSPVEVAQWIEDCAASGLKSLADFEARATGKERPEFRRLAIDIGIQAGLGRFFGARFRSGVLYRIFEQTGSRGALEESLRQYRAARAIWAEFANRAKDVYVPDITVGERPQLRGHWLDRLPSMDADIAALEKKLEEAKGATEQRVSLAIRDALSHPRRAPVICQHTPPRRFQPGQPLAISISTKAQLASVRLHYRHVNHAERYEAVEMTLREKVHSAVIPAGYTESQYPIQYYFELRHGPDGAALYPGLGPELIQQPYFLVER